MQHYLEQLINDLKTSAREHLARPSPLDHHAHKDEDGRLEAELEQHFADVERYVAGESDGTMFTIIGLPPEAFPPAERLTDTQIGTLTGELLKTWKAFSTYSDHPKEIPVRLLYPELLRVMHEPCLIGYGGSTSHQDYCYGESNDCPWPPEFCRCKDFDDEECL